jgi:hypothetical protein
MTDHVDWRSTMALWRTHPLQSDPDPLLVLHAGASGARATPEPNYLKKMRYLMRVGALPKDTGLHMINVYHDDWCGHLRGGRCDCSPDVRLKASVSDTRRN